MQNKVELGDGNLVCIELRGQQTGESIREVNHRAQELIVGHGLTNPNFLMDISTVGKSDSQSRKAGNEMIKSLEFNKMALFGAKGFIKQLAALVIKASGKSATVRQFDTVAEAERWLAETTK